MRAKKLFNTEELSIRLAQHVVASTGRPAWRCTLLSDKLFGQAEIDQLSERELALVQRAVLTVRFRTMNEAQLLQAAQEYHLPWRLEADHDAVAVAVAY